MRLALENIDKWPADFQEFTTNEIRGLTVVDVHFSETEADFAAVFVISPTGMLVGVFWGSRLEVCQSIDEVTDPNDCKYQHCEPGGIRLGCFRGEQEITVAAYNDAAEENEAELRLEGLTDDVAASLDVNDTKWLPIVPPGYQYTAGLGLTKNDSEWN